MTDKSSLDNNKDIKPNPAQDSSDSPCIIESPASLFNLVDEVIRQKKGSNKQ